MDRDHLLVDIGQKPAGKGQLDRELFLGELVIPFSLPPLPRQASELGLNLRDQVLDPLKVQPGFLQAALGALLPVAIEPDAGGLFKQRAALLSPVRQEDVDHLGFDYDTGVTAQPGTPKQILDIAQTRRGPVKQVVALARAGKPPGDDDLLVRDGEIALRVVEIQGDLGHVHRPPTGGALKDHIFHLAPTQESGGLLAQHPTHRIGHVGLAAPIGADDRGDTFFEMECDGIGERFEARELELRRASSSSQSPVRGASHFAGRNVTNSPVKKRTKGERDGNLTGVPNAAFIQTLADR